MATDFLALEQDYNRRAQTLHKAGGEPLAAFRNLVRAVGGDGALDHRTKELIALAIAIATRCEGCIVFHARACLRLKVRREELVEMIGVAVEMGGGPASVYGATALACFDQMAEAAAAG